MNKISRTLRDAFSKAISESFGPEAAGVDPAIRPSTDPQFGDFQSNAAMVLAKRVGLQPRALAARIVENLPLSGVASRVEVAGPGFINVHLDDSWMAEALGDYAADSAIGVEAPRAPQKVVVDYSAPNVAKEMHVGHLRSTVIGDAIARVLSHVGHNVIRQNHIGDWGTQFGMLIEYIAELGWDPKAGHSINDLNELYRSAKTRFDSDADFAERARRRVVSLQGGDEASIELWKLLISESKKHFEQVYARLGVLLDEGDYCAESFYNASLPGVVEELRRIGLAIESEGALCIFPDGFTGVDGKPTPLMLRKSDGGFGYDTTDMAAIRYRTQVLEADRLIYVVDIRQKQHFAMIFRAARDAGWLKDALLPEHVAFGTVLGEDGTPFKTRSGETVKLADLLDEAERRALEIVEGKNPELGAAEKAAIAHSIGIGAIKYADLSNDRVKDYVFSWERMLSFDGNTAPYLQNAYVRIRSLFRRAEEKNVSFGPGPIRVGTAEERALALKLLQFADTLSGIESSLEPHRLCNFLYEICALYHRFWEHCPVLSTEDMDLRASRLRLSELCSRVIGTGFSLLGIEALDRM